jgi:hypothetical protein
LHETIIIVLAWEADGSFHNKPLTDGELKLISEYQIVNHSSYFDRAVFLVQSRLVNAAIPGQYVEVSTIGPISDLFAADQRRFSATGGEQ